MYNDLYFEKSILTCRIKQIGVAKLICFNRLKTIKRICYEIKSGFLKEYQACTAQTTGMLDNNNGQNKSIYKWPLSDL